MYIEPTIQTVKDYDLPMLMGYVNGQAIFEGDCTWICCILDENLKPNIDDYYPF